jgi:UDP-2,3-diacylglucosamine hydrolase
VRKLGIIAGGGVLPGQIVAACRETGRPYFVLAFEGAADPATFPDAPMEWIRASALGRALDIARRENVEELVLVGGIKRPSLLDLMRDVRSARFLAKVGTRMLGDDNLLSAVAHEIEESEGFDIVAPDDILADILATPGAYGSVEPAADDRADIERGFAVVRAMGALDIGQCAVVQNGRVLGVEGAEGTDRLIARCAEFLRTDEAGGVFVKAPKPSQERRIDLPTVGLTTVQGIIRAGLRGIAVEVGGVLVVDRAAIIAEADRAGVYFVGIDAANTPSVNDSGSLPA